MTHYFCYLILFCMFGNLRELSIRVLKQREKVHVKTPVLRSSKNSKKFRKSVFREIMDRALRWAGGGHQGIGRPWAAGPDGPRMGPPLASVAPLRHPFGVYLHFDLKTLGRHPIVFSPPVRGGNQTERKSSPTGRNLSGKFPPSGGNCRHGAGHYRDHHQHHFHHQHLDHHHHPISFCCNT